MKKLISIVLTLAMILGMSVSAFAGESTIDSVEFTISPTIDVNKLSEFVFETDISVDDSSTSFYGYDATYKFLGYGSYEDQWGDEDGNPIDTSKIKYVYVYWNCALDVDTFEDFDSINIKVNGTKLEKMKIPYESLENTYIETASYDVGSNEKTLDICVPITVVNEEPKPCSIFQKLILAILGLFGTTTIVYFLSKMWNL